MAAGRAVYRYHEGVSPSCLYLRSCRVSALFRPARTGFKADCGAAWLAVEFDAHRQSALPPPDSSLTDHPLTHFRLMCMVTLSPTYTFQNVFKGFFAIVCQCVSVSAVSPCFIYPFSGYSSYSFTAPSGEPTSHPEEKDQEDSNDPAVPDALKKLSQVPPA